MCLGRSENLVGLEPLSTGFQCCHIRDIFAQKLIIIIIIINQFNYKLKMELTRCREKN